MTPRSFSFVTPNVFVLVLLVLVGAGSRFLDVAPNATAIGAIALFAGFFFRNRWMAVAAPIGAMVLSDLAIGFYDWRLMAVVYAALAAPVMFRGMLGLRPTVGRIVGGGVAATALFFVATNFGVWAFGHGYEKTGAGLAACYAAAVPFVKYQLIADVVCSLGVFGVWAWMTRARDEMRGVVVAAG